MKEVTVEFVPETGIWEAFTGERDEIIASGISPEEAVRNYHKMQGIPLAKPEDLDWIDPFKIESHE